MSEYPDCRDIQIFGQVNESLEESFNQYAHKFKTVKELAQNIRKRIDEISPFIQQNTRTVCPDCNDKCCINKHGYYNFEDLVYINALGLKPTYYDFTRNDSDPCQFLAENGCSLERPIRPSGCNWYFCSPLLESMEKSPGYQQFDASLTELAELWLNMIEEFKRIANRLYHLIY
jgi:hypothetical protein